MPRGGARQGAGRKPSADPKKLVPVRLTSTEMEAIRRTAESHGKPASRWMRDVILEAVEVGK